MAIDIGAKIQVDGEASYSKQISQIIGQQKELKAQMQGVEAAFKADATNKEKAAQRTRLLTEQLGAANQKLEKQKAQLRELEDSGKGASKQADNLRVAISRTEAEIEQLNKELRQNSGMVAFGKDLQEAGAKIEKVGAGLTKFGTTMTRNVTAPLTAAAAIAVKLATEFETAVAKLNSIADGSVPLEELKNQILDLSNQTGIAASELAEQAYQAISAGQDTASSVRFVADTTKLAKAGFAETGNALDVLTTILNAYGKKTSETTAISDKLITVQNLGKTTVAQLSENMGQAIPTAAAYGVDLDNIGAAYVTLTKQGINTANATTQINGLLNQLGKSGTTAANVLKEKTGKGFKELMTSGMSLTDVLFLVKEAADENGLSLNDMFGNVRAGRAAMALMNDEGVTFTNSLSALANAAGATSTAFEKVTNTTAYQFEVALNKVKNVGIDAGQQILITFAPAIEKIGSAIDKAIKSFDNMSNAEKQAMIRTAAFAASIGPAAVALGNLTKGIGNVTKGVGTLIEKWGMLGKVPGFGVTGIVAGFVALSGALAVLSMNAEKYAGDFGEVVRASEKVNDKTKELTGTILESSEAYRVTNTSIEDNKAKAQSLISDLDKLSKQTNLTASEQTKMVSAVDELNALYPGLGLTIDTNTGRLSQNTTEIQKNIEKLSEQARVIAAQERAVEINRQLLDIESQIAKVQEQRKEAANSLAEATKKQSDAAATGVELYGTAVSSAAVSVSKLDKDLESLQTQQSELNKDLDVANAYLDENSSALEGAAANGETFSDTIDDVTDSLEDEMKAAQEAADKVAAGAKLQAGAFEKVEKAQTKSIQSMIEGLRSQIKAQANYNDNLATLYNYIRKDTENNWSDVVQIIQDGGINMAGELQGIVDAIRNGETEYLNELVRGNDELNKEFERAGRNAQKLPTAVDEAYKKTRNVEQTQSPLVISNAKATATGIGTSYDAGMKTSKAIMLTGTEGAFTGAKGKVQAAQAPSKAAASEVARGTGQSYIDAINVQKERMKAAGDSAGKAGGNAVKSGAMSTKSGVTNSGAAVMDGLRIGINGASPAVKRAADAVGKSGGSTVVNAMRSKRSDAETAGEYVALGLKVGIQRKQNEINQAAQATAQSALRTMKNTAQVKSPSRVTTEIGEYIAEGLVVGMLNRIKAVKAEAAELAQAALPNVANNYLDITGSVGLDPDEMYSAVREGASDATQNIYLNGRDLTRGLKGLGVAFTNG